MTSKRFTSLGTMDYGGLQVSVIEEDTFSKSRDVRHLVKWKYISYGNQDRRSSSRFSDLLRNPRKTQRFNDTLGSLPSSDLNNPNNPDYYKSPTKNPNGQAPSFPLITQLTEP